jgi:hypothetical protein
VKPLLIVAAVIFGLPVAWVLLCLVIVTAPVTIPAGVGAFIVLAVCRPRFGASPSRRRERRVRAGAARPARPRPAPRRR